MCLTGPKIVIHVAKYQLAARRVLIWNHGIPIGMAEYRENEGMWPENHTFPWIFEACGGMLRSHAVS